MGGHGSLRERDSRPDLDQGDSGGNGSLREGDSRPDLDQGDSGGMVV